MAAQFRILGPVEAVLDGGPPDELRRSTEAEWLEQLRLTALELRCDAELACGRHEALVAELETLTAEHPYRERFLEQQMLALYRCGRQADAGVLIQPVERALFDEAKAAAEEELGEEYAAIHEAAMAAPLDQALQEGDVLAKTRSS